MSAYLDFHQPVNQDRPHLWGESGLNGHVVTKGKLFLQTITVK